MAINDLNICQITMIKYLAVFVNKLKNCIPERTLTGENWIPESG